jgi:hypothetical protein
MPKFIISGFESEGRGCEVDPLRTENPLRGWGSGKVDEVREHLDMVERQSDHL